MAEKIISLEIVDLEERIAPCGLATAALHAVAIAPPGDVVVDPPVDTPNLGSAAGEHLPPQATCPEA